MALISPRQCNNINRNYFLKNSWCPLSTTTELSKTCYATLSSLQKMKIIAPFNIRKHLCESLVLCKLDYCSSIFDPLTISQQRRLQKIENSCAALLFHQYCSALGVATS